MKVFCPIDRYLVTLDSKGLGRCPQCLNILTLVPLILEFHCEHIPRPLQGSYRYDNITIPYEYCSLECKISSEQIYPSDFIDLGFR